MQKYLFGVLFSIKNLIEWRKNLYFVEQINYVMILVVDGGSTKTHVTIIGNSSNSKEILMPGINPYYQSESEIVDLIQQNITLDLATVSKVYHYGAGCSFPEKKDIVRKAWLRFCSKADVFVDSDMLGAAKAVLGDEDGIACILGTGANSCFCKNGKIERNVPPLGFILGDEGSGAYLGGKLVADAMKGILPSDLVDGLYAQFGCTPQDIMNAVYKQPLPSRYLASFVPFIASNIERPEIKSIVENAFTLFFRRNVALYGQSACKLGFVGGVAKQFEQELKSVADDFGFPNVEILGDPMPGLIAYHKNLLKPKN